MGVGAGAGDGSGSLGAGNEGTAGQQQQGTFSPVPPAGVQNMAALYLKVCVVCFAEREDGGVG